LRIIAIANHRTHNKIEFLWNGRQSLLGPARTNAPQENLIFVEQARKPVADIGAVFHPRRINAQNKILNNLNLF
jgi:hypothetical protein